MSGGSFDYAYEKVNGFAYDLGEKLREFDRKDEYGYQPNMYPPEVRAKLREIMYAAKTMSDLMREVEWLYSGNTGEDSFMRRVAEIENSRDNGTEDW